MKCLEPAFRQFRSTEQQLSLRDPALKDLFGGGSMTASGQHITEFNAIKISAVYACVRLIAEKLASLPLTTYRRMGPGKGTQEAVDHPVYDILKNAANPFMTSTEFLRTQQGVTSLVGNSAAYIERNGSGQVVALWPWKSTSWRMDMIDGKLFYYHYDEKGGFEVYRQDEVLHIRGLGGDGYCGYSMITTHRELFGLSNASIEYRARFFANDARPGGVLKHPLTLSPQAHSNLRKTITDQTTGNNKRSFMILEEGMDWKDVGIPPNDAQYIEGHIATKEDICGIFGVPAHKIGVMKSGTVSYASVEQSNRAFWEDCIRHIADNWEKRLRYSLFTPTERQSYFVKFNPTVMLWGDAKEQAEKLQIERRNGIINADEWRELLDMNPLPNGEGKTYICESNMTRLDQVGESDEPQAPALTNGAAKPAQLTNGAAH